MMFYVAHSRRVGFTLIEIMIVIAIIAILAGIVVPNVVEAREEAKLVACRQSIMAVVNAIEMAVVRCGYVELVKNKMGGYSLGGNWMSSTGGVYAFLVDNEYLGKVVYCPVSGIRPTVSVFTGMSGGIGPGFVVQCGINGVGLHVVGGKRICPSYVSSGGRSGWEDNVQ